MKSAISLLLAFLSSISAFSQANHPRRGIVDLRNYDFETKGHIDLSGEWVFYMDEFVAPTTLSSTPANPGDYVTFPMVWNDMNKSRKPGEGFGTFFLRILVNRQELALELPHFYSSYKLWINGEVVTSNGTVGTNKETSEPEWRPQTIVFNPHSDTLDLVIHASNFHHAKGGVRDNILIGLPEDLNFKREVAILSNIILTGGLVIIFITFSIVYAIIRRDRSSLLFAALCITWSIRAAFSNLYIGPAFFDGLSWEVCVKIEYITLYLTMIWAILFLASLFPEDVNSLFKYLFVGSNAIFVFFTLTVSAALYTQFLPVYLSFSLVLLLYIVYVLIHAFVYERQGVWLIVSCIMLGVVLFAYDLSAYQGLATFNPLIINVGYLIMFMLLAVCLAFQFGILKRTSGKGDMLTYDDLYGKKP